MTKKLKLLGTIALWIVNIFETLTMGMIGFAKFGDAERWQGLFVGWGYPVWFTSVIGLTEMTGALLLLVPRFTAYAATLLIAVMIGALATVLLHPGEMGPDGPIVHMVLLGILLLGRLNLRWRPSATDKD